MTRPAAGPGARTPDDSWAFLALLKELEVEIDPQLLDLALTHRSYAFEHGGLPTNERLEFLGDAVLEIGTTDYLYRAFPELSEGSYALVPKGTDDVQLRVDVHGGQVTSADWPA